MHWMETVRYRRSVKVNSYGHIHHQAEPEGCQRKGKNRITEYWSGEVGAFRMEVTQERRMET